MLLTAKDFFIMTTKLRRQVPLKCTIILPNLNWVMISVSRGRIPNPISRMCSYLSFCWSERERECFRLWVWMQWAGSSPLQHLAACASTCFRLYYYYYLPTGEEYDPTLFLPFPALYDRVRWGKSCGWRGGEALQSVRRSAAAVQRAQIALLLTQIPPVPRHTGLTLTPAQQDMAGCPRQTRLTIIHTPLATESVPSIINLIKHLLWW